MGKLVIKHRGKPVGEVNLKLGDTIIGRSSSCDVVIKDDKSVSARHAVIKTIGRSSVIEDLNSTNGTFIETARIKRRELKHGDIIIIGEHELRFRDVVEMDSPLFGGRAAKPEAITVTPQEKTRVITAFAQLAAVEGKDAGRTVPLMKEETVLDNPGKNPARIYRSPEGYVLHAQVGPGEPRLNGKPVQPGGQLLESGDIIEVAGTKYRFN